MPLHSVHTFMLPLRWDYLPKGFDPSIPGSGIGNAPFDDRTKLEDFIKLLTPRQSADGNAWKRKFYRIDKKPGNFNELVYYHAHAANNFLDLQKEGETDEYTLSANKAVIYFELNNINCAIDKYIIHVVKGPNDKAVTYALNLSGIGLHVFTTGVAVLTFTLKNCNYPNPEDILFINEFGRRIHPPFIDERTGLAGTQEKVLAGYIELNISALKHIPGLKEDFGRYRCLNNEQFEVHEYINGAYRYNKIIDIPEFVKKLFPQPGFVFAAGDETGGERIRFRLLMSDRMFFQCWYGNNRLAGSFSETTTLRNGATGYRFAQSPFWYAFMYGDKSTRNLGIGNNILMEEHLLRNTYTRWAGYGTVYGFTRDSFVCVSSDLETLTWNKVPDLSLHMQTMYYTMAVLSLAQRASVLRFSGEVAALTDLGRKWTKEINERIQNLNLNYTEFINKIYYREITPEIQGIEIYNHFQQAMNIEPDVNDLGKEIAELYNFAMLKKQDDQTRESVWLTKIATWFLPPTLLFSILGSNFLPEGAKFRGCPDPNTWAWIGFVAALSLVIILCIQMFKNYSNKKDV
ncbi:MAG: hypothetical protein JNM68_17435 [Dinghuibacter sp.]|nr:hypothetical protein [Dinghuibacter sp.]